MLFNEIIPSYSESYYQEIKKLKIEVVEEKQHGGIVCLFARDALTDDENYLEYENVGVGELKGYVVVWIAVLLRSGALENTEKITKTRCRCYSNDGKIHAARGKK